MCWLYIRQDDPNYSQFAAGRQEGRKAIEELQGKEKEARKQRPRSQLQAVRQAGRRTLESGI